MTRRLRATYRLQFNAGFTFADAEALVPYLAALGVSHLYASPIFAARPGSPHGYDGIDPNRLNPELGTEAEFASLVAALHRADLGLIVDIVPNHMAVHRGNLPLQQALCLGPASDAARIFDIDWRPGRVALPFLGGDLDAVIDEITLERDTSGLLMAVYHDHAFALRAATAARLVEPVDPRLAGLWRSLEDAPDQSRFDDAALATARLDAGELAAVLADADVAAVLGEQRWQPADWRTAADALHHRRFFNITELIGVRVEDPEVFDRTHRLAIELVRKGDVDGLRIDHIDGLADPEAYCHRLRAAIGPDATIHVEKILGFHETLPDWPVDGTTGYERLNEINRLFVDGPGYARLDAHLVEARALAGDFAARLAAAKRLVLDETFQAEIDGLVALGEALDNALPPDALRAAIVALIVHFPVYRSYVTERGWSEQDLAAWRPALAATRTHADRPTADAADHLFETLREGAPAAFAFITRFQQLSGPAMAKGLEDTELYRSVALASVNEVGSEPDAPAATPAATHAAVARRAGTADRSLVPLATHDTKRGPDTRARLNLLSLDPEAWIDTVEACREAADAIRDDAGAPDLVDEWLTYQTVLGAWPIDADRLTAYLTKAMREAKRHTRWEEPNKGYEGAVTRFAERLLTDPGAEPARSALLAHVRRLEAAGRINGIAQTILQLALPGIPDIYQGTELWDHSLVDPDNRRPVDWALRRRLLEAPTAPPPAEDADGAGKIAATRALLALRRRDPELMLDGTCEPLPDAGRAVFAFLRRRDDRALLVAVPLCGRPAAVALPRELAGRPWTDLVRGGALGLRPDFALESDWPFLVALRT